MRPVELPLTLAAALRHRAERNPTSRALVGAAGQRSVTYEELFSHVDERVAAFTQRGVSVGDRVIVEMTPTVEIISTLIALWTLGATVVPIRDRDGDGRREALGTALSARFAVSDGLLQCRRDGQVHEDTGDVLLVMTSGSTGAPKAVRHSHQSVQAGCEMVATAWKWTHEDTLILALPLTHVHGLIVGLLGSLLVGASISLLPTFDPGGVSDAVANGATMFFGVPTMYHAIVERGLERTLAPLRLCVSGSAPLDPQLASRLESVSVPILERYGMTETLLTLSQPLSGKRRLGWVGEPFPGVEVAVDAEGQLHVRTPAASPGFVLPTISPLPVSVEGFFPTGDLVERDGKQFKIAGRASDLIITGGVNVFPAEVEQVLAGFPGIREVAVAGRPSPKWGEEVTAFIIATADGVDVEALRAFAALHLRPPARPKSYVVVDDFPRTELGKVRRRELAGS